MRQGLVVSLACLMMVCACKGSGDTSDNTSDSGSQTRDSGAIKSGPADSGPDGATTTAKGDGGTTTTQGDGGTTTGDGGGTTAQPGRCDEQCSEASDCGVGYGCAGEHCECISDDLCIASRFKFNTEGCTTDTDCTGGERCVEWAGSTFCAEVDGNQFAICLSPQGHKLVLQLADGPDGGEGKVVICHGGAPIRCAAGTKRCEVGCADNGDCGFPPGMNTCHLDTGRCGCTNDADGDSCETGGGYQCTADRVCGCAEDGRCLYSDDGPYCDVATGGCGCKIDDDCSGSYNGNFCVNGKCGCRFSDECRNNEFSGTHMVCVPE